jgi:uncharacterized membrane protein
VLFKGLWVQRHAAKWWLEVVFMRVIGSSRLINLTKGGAIAAAYFLLSLPFGVLNFGANQLRLAEVLMVLPVFDVSAVAGVTIGCVLTNLQGAMSGLNLIWDVFVGSFATFLAAVVARKARNQRLFNLPVISFLAPVLINAVIIGLELTFVEVASNFNWLVALKNILRVGFGEFLACVVLGVPFYKLLAKTIFNGKN